MGNLRSTLARPGCLAVPGVYDPLSGLLAARAGFDVVALSGNALEASQFGLPDYGFIGTSDVVDAAQRILDAVDIDLICDIDTGFGGARNVWRTVERLERVGVSAVHIEDQITPKQCGALAGKSVVAVEDMTDKIRAAVDARRSADFLVIGRSDALETEGLASVVARLNTYLEAGADIAYASEHYSHAQIAALARQVKGPLMISAGVPGWPDSFETTDRYAELGVSIALTPFACLLPAVRAMADTLAAMHARGGIAADRASRSMFDPGELNDILGLPAWQEREAAIIARRDAPSIKKSAPPR